MASNGLDWPAGTAPWEMAHLPGSSNVQDGADAGRLDQPNASRRVALLEAGLKNTQSHNLHLKHHVTFLEAQMFGQLGHISTLQMRVKALESELASLKANLGHGPNAGPASSQAVNSVATDLVAANPVAAGTTPPPSPASAPAPDLDPTVPAQQCEPEPGQELMPPNPAAPGGSGNYARLHPTGSDGSGTALTASGLGQSGAVPPATTGRAARSPSSRQAPQAAANSLASALDDGQVGPFVDPASTKTAPAETSSAVDAEQGGSSSSCNSATTAVLASATPRHPLHDFWADSSHNLDNSPPASNIINHSLRDDSVLQHQHSKPSPPNGRVLSDRANVDTEDASESVRDDVAPTTRVHAEEREPNPAAKATVKTEELVAQAKPGAVVTPLIQCAMGGGKGAEDRSSHLVDCALCQDPLPEDEPIGRCEVCPRSFCTQCLEHGLHEQGVDVEGLNRDCRAMLAGEKGDFFVDQCPHCIRGCDDNFAAPPPGAVPMEHLLNELLRHDLSICFRDPVDTNKHTDYVEAIGRDAMIDLGTMLDKLKRKKYPRRRGRGQFLDDLNRIWRNCRKYAGCDELGQPYYGTTVPGIVRCALILEAMSIKFCAAHMSDNQGTDAWQESTWDFHRQKQEQINTEARLKQLKKQAKTSGAKPLVSSGVGREWANVAAKQECGEGSSSSGIARRRSAGEEHDTPGDGSGTESCSVQNQETLCSAGGRHKRRAAAMEGATHTENAHSKTSAEANGATSGGTSGGTPKTPKRLAGETKLLRPLSSPLDELCHLASTFQK